MASSPTQPRYPRVLVKLSGEALMGGQTHGLDQATVMRIARDLAATAAAGAQVAVVVGGGNFFRGLQGADKGIERARGDSIGMLATVMNALALEQAVEAQGQSARTLSAVAMPSICQPYSRQAALAHLAKRRVVVLGGGTGNPFFTTDTGAALRAAELSCDVLMKATQVDGIYTADPKKDPNARRYDTLTHDEAIEKRLAVMDTAAFALARENRIPIIVFSLAEPGAIGSAWAGRGRHTLVLPPAI
ncbi:MAG: UMP kinase [Rhodoblastus sp.]